MRTSGAACATPPVVTAQGDSSYSLIAKSHQMARQFRCIVGLEVWRRIAKSSRLFVHQTFSRGAGLPTTVSQLLVLAQKIGITIEICDHDCAICLWEYSATVQRIKVTALGL